MFRVSIGWLENVYGVTFRLPYNTLSGKGRDGITEAQKVALRKWHVNTTGIRYKAEACKVLQFLSDRTAKGLASIWDLYQIKQREIITNKVLKDLTAEEAKQFLSTKAIISNKKHLYQVKAEMPDGVHSSQLLFTTETDAEVHAAKKVPPEYDCVIVEYTEPFWFLDVQPPIYVTNSAAAQKLARGRDVMPVLMVIA